MVKLNEVILLITIGTYIKYKRESFNITREKLIYQIEYLSHNYFGEDNSISISTLARIESGKLAPSLKQLDLISTALNIDLLEKYSEFRFKALKKTKSIINSIPSAILKNDILRLKKYRELFIENHNSNSLYIYKLIDDNIALIESYLDLNSKNYKSAFLKSSHVINISKASNDFQFLHLKNNYKIICLSIMISCTKYLNTNLKLDHNFLYNILESDRSIICRVALNIIKNY